MRFYKKLRNLATITTVSTICVYLINKLVFSLSSMKDALFSKYGNTYSWRFGSLYYTKHGTGSPLLLIHDLNNCSSELEFYKIKEELSRSHTVYTLDLLGCGRSDKPRITYTSYLYVQLINDFIKNVIGTKTDIIASGKSSSLIFLACYTEPRNFSRLMMINPESRALSREPQKSTQIFYGASDHRHTHLQYPAQQTNDPEKTCPGIFPQT